MSSPLQRLTRGRKTVSDEARAAMLSRLGIAEEKPRDLFRAPEPEPVPETAAPAALSRPAEPEPQTLGNVAWSQPANDEHIPAFPTEVPAARTLAPEPAPEPPEDPFEAIRRQYRKPPAGLSSLPRPNVQIPRVQMPQVHIPHVPIPGVQIRIPSAGVRRRKGGELNTVRKVIWGLATLASGMIGWALLTGDESSPIVQVFGMLLP